MSRRSWLVAACLALALAGCGGQEPPPLPAPTVPSAAVDQQSQLRRAALRALRENHRLSVSVLRTNRLPTAAASTAGPALKALRAAAALRAERGMRVRTLAGSYRVLSLRLAPTYLAAIATVVDRQTVQPETLAGQRVGGPRQLVERAAVELRRVPGTDRFVVWNLEVLP